MKAIFFDLDGTLSDPKPGITGSIQYALSSLGRPAPAADQLTWCIGPPLLESFASLLGDTAEAAAALELYRERYSQTGLYENAVYDGIPEALEAARSAGLELFVATSKPHVYAVEILRHFGLQPFCARVFGAELDGTRADKTSLLRHALQATGIDPKSAMMVGDRALDIIAAANTGLGSVGVLYGYGSAAELKAAGAGQLIREPAELPPLFEAGPI